MPYAEIPKQPISAPETAGTNPVTIKISSRAATEVMQIPTICLGFSFCFSSYLSLKNQLPLTYC